MQNTDTWKFDQAVARRFQEEASKHIPDYQRVINLCLDVARQKFTENSRIIDIGSALGYTVDLFRRAGFENTCGAEASQEMIDASQRREHIIKSDCFPQGQYDLVMINWTLHFIEDKIKYLSDVFTGLNDNGILIVTDKTQQSSLTKNLYYRFKIDNGVDFEYIKQKEQQLTGKMHLMPASWYPEMLEKLGFKSIEVINARLGFVTYMCVKN